MTTATTDLSWVTFSGDTTDVECWPDECTLQATHAGLYELVGDEPCECPRRVPYCLWHKDLILRRAEKHGYLFRCRRCEGAPWLLLLGMEPL